MSESSEIQSQNPQSPKSRSIRLVDFFEAVRRIERSSGLRLGTDLKPSQEPVVIKADVDLHFAPTEVASFTDEQSPPELRVAFYGLFGPSGALPHHYTQLIVDRCRNRDYALRDFLDMFNHRLLSFFYRGWEKNHFPVAFETARASNQDDVFTGMLRALIGFRTEGLRDRLSFPSDDTLYFAGLFADRRPTASGLQGMVQSAFDVEAEVEEFVEQEMLITEPEQSRIGVQPFGISTGNRLGVDTVAGKWIKDFENRFRIRIGPLSYARFLEFNPESPKLRQVFDLVRLYVGAQFDFDVQPAVKAEEVPNVQLGNPRTARLGWNTWLGQWRHQRDADDAIFELTDSVV